MTEDAERRTLLTRYLLGQVSQEERDQIEERYLRDDELFEELVASENDIIDEYTRGELTRPEKQQFEERFLSNREGRRRVQFAKSLSPDIGSLAPSEDRAEPEKAWAGIAPAISRFAMAAGLLAVLAGLIWMVLGDWKLREQLEAAQSEQESTRRQLLELRQQMAEVQRAEQRSEVAPMPAEGTEAVSVALVPDLARGPGQQTTLRIFPGVSEVRMLLRREKGESTSYDVVLETVEGLHVWQKKNLTAVPAANLSSVVVVDVPPNILQRGDYVLSLREPGKGEELAVYSFRIIRP